MQTRTRKDSCNFFFTRKVNTVIFIDWSKALSPSQNDKAMNLIMITCVCFYDNLKSR